MTNMESYRKFAAGLHEAAESVRYWSSDQFFMNLRELAADNHFAIAEDFREIRERSPDSVRRLEEDDGSGNDPQVIQPRLSVFRPRRWKSGKEKRIGWEACGG